ncbi:DNA-processing protein DprA [Granulicella mallensis]|uniref:DNA protecting protein DprA n=1 Tax=Granulicella mallensis (strain ATCC BAA-1857 / DSM 23137 / MP5ACTX8) TaxID=682795 RepID=G8NXX8_GRAMM|nr:DNA-processing protein DprA [Granulicella mallensis]AEU35566.1 DNA protecting protein DprA [Granulicella mallensis MP5ACTX8]
MSQGVKEEARLAWLALVLTPRMGPTRCGRTVQRLGAVERVFSASLTELESTGMPAEAAQFCFDGRSRAAALDEAQRVAEAGASFVTPADDHYPQRLLEIYDPPPVLWVRGNAEVLNRAGIAVVGTRHPTPYGSGMAEMLSRDLARRGVVILSGMARGVDTCAHKGALDAGGITIAVWGTGIDVIYPKENKKLAEQIVQQGGALISEFPMGTFPAPQNFPIRNRTLSGMSVGVLVVEAAEYSGTRITARCALEQSRDVYAVPGNATNKNAWGPNTLIKQGAKLTATWEDVWEDLPSQVRAELEGRLEAQTGAGNRGNESSNGGSASLFPGAATLFPEAAAMPPMSEQERLVMQHLRQDEALQLDELIERLEPKMVSGEVFTALFELELAGRVKQMPGKNYVRSF